MKNLTKDIEVGLSILNLTAEEGQIPDKYDYPYENTNEDLSIYMPQFPIKNGTIITVAGSGDQQLQIAKEKPKSIHVFDRNPLAIHMAKLKTAAIKALTYEEFISFLGIKSKKRYRLDEYYKIRDYLDRESKYFWDKMYLDGEFELRHAYLLQEGDDTANKGPSNYMIERNFNQTKRNICDIEIAYYDEELFDFFSKLPNDFRFDIAFLSNIYDWLPKEKQNIFAEFVKSEVSEKLNENGMIAAYSCPKGLYYDIELESEFDDSIELPDNDKVLVYKKLKVTTPKRW